MSVNVKETHKIKPTNPTQHLPIILSNIDVIIPKMYVLVHYFFKNVSNEENFMDVHKLRASLEDILSDYYPLAGQFKMEPEGRMSIVCSDQGIPFVVAESPNITIQQLEEKNWENSSIPSGLLPVAQIPKSIDAPLFAVQHTTLADGSVVLGIAMHHSVTDSGLFIFLGNWGLKARQKQFTLPIHDRSLLKASGNPPTQKHPEFIVIDPKVNRMPPKLPPMSKKIFYFSKDNLKKLRDDYSSKNSWISTNDALVGHLWRTVTRARGTPLDAQVNCIVSLDGRKKLNPPLSPNYFGNVVLGVHPNMPVFELINGPKSNIALNIRKEIEKMNDSRIRSTLDWIEQQTNKHAIIVNSNFFVTTWSKFPIYDLDFGYGTPFKFRLQTGSQVNGLVVVLETPANDDGLEVYIGLITEHLQKLEQDPEFKMYQ